MLDPNNMADVCTVYMRVQGSDQSVIFGCGFVRAFVDRLRADDAAEDL